MRAAVHRGIVAGFCWVTAIYAFLASSAFAYQQFLRPRVFRSVGLFADWHSIIYWGWLVLAVGSIAGDLRKKGPARMCAASFVVICSLYGVWLARSPLLPTLADNRRSVIAGLVALVPVLWLALIDHLSSWPQLASRSAEQTTDSLRSTETRLLVASLGTVVFVVVLYAALTPLAVAGRFEPDLLTSGLMFGLAWNGLDHMWLFCAAFLVMALIERTIGRTTGLLPRYVAVFVFLTAVLTVAMQRTFTEAVGIDAAWAMPTSLALSASLVSTWAGVRIRSQTNNTVEKIEVRSGFDVFFGPRPSSQSALAHLIWIAAVAALAYALAFVAGRMDWDFLLLKLGVIAVWVIVFDHFYRTAPSSARVAPAVVLVACALPLVGVASEDKVERALPRWLNRPGWTLRHTLDRYLVYNPSFRLADGLVHDGSDDTPTFDRFLRANTGVGVDVPAVDITFVPALETAPVTPVPDVFLLVVDSLRPDYLAPYNRDVTFTPRIADFARDNVVFRNAFTRYGGTGLSVPSIWMGAAGPHKQYVQPFHPMNALEKLLDANAYTRFVSLDHIMVQLLAPSPRTIELDRGVPEMAYDLCGTLDELSRDLQRVDPAAPVFGTTRSLNLHVAAVRNGAVPPGELYPGFEAPYAARVHRIDRCFGEFIDGLKQRGAYDRSIVILTSDHGELLGEDGRWGHAYYLFPEVLRIPMLVHFPRSIVERASIDPTEISFSTDITPTLYAALGYAPARQTILMGQSLIGGSRDRDPNARRRASQVVIASYGAVYGVLTRNGRRLYIIDGNHRTEFGYERRGDAWVAAGVSEPFRQASQRAIREYLDEIAIEYHLP